jgi:hypothetical protein
MSNCLSSTLPSVAGLEGQFFSGGDALPNALHGRLGQATARQQHKLRIAITLQIELLGSLSP